jgi:hypothetical protein
MDQGWFACALVTAAEMSTARKKCTHARFGPVSVWWTPASTHWCLASVRVSSRGLFASGLFSFCSSIACRNAARCEMTVAGIRYARRFYTGHIHMEYASLLAFFSPDFKRTFYSAFVKLDVLFETVLEILK